MRKMAMRSLLRKGPALARALGSPASHAPSPTLRPRSPTFQAVQPAAGSRSLSQGQGAAAGGQAISEEMLRERGKRVDAEFHKNMKALQKQHDEFWRLEV